MYRLLALVALASICSALLTHITGTSMPGRLFINRQFLAVSPDGAVYGTIESNHVDTIFKRFAVDINRIVIQNAITCVYLCMDRCGQLYGSKTLSNDCFMREFLEENNYNTYYKVYDRKLTYVALKNNGIPRKLQILKSRKLGKLSVYSIALLKRLSFPIYTSCPNIKSEIIVRHRKCYV
ncbi:fgf [Troides aeacus nucleopolyhedrovirus]|nr:fgf [Troides aeacus nucleopolyhedrovirus]